VLRVHRTVAPRTVYSSRKWTSRGSTGSSDRRP